MAVGKLSFSSNNVEEINLGCRNLQMTLTLSEIFLGGMPVWYVDLRIGLIKNLFNRRGSREVITDEM